LRCHCAVTEEFRRGGCTLHNFDLAQKLLISPDFIQPTSDGFIGPSISAMTSVLSETGSVIEVVLAKSSV
jgi:hypothetical protein